MSACSNTCYLPATRLFQLPVCMSNKLQCLLAQQNIIKRTLDFGCVGEGRRWRISGEGLVLLLIKNEELVHIDRT